MADLDQGSNDYPTTHSDALARYSFQTKPFIGGAFVEARSEAAFETRNPGTGEKIGDISACGEEDVDIAVRSARETFESGVWSKMEPRERKKTLLRFSDLIEKNLQELAVLETLDSGKPITDCRTIDLPDVIETMRWHAEVTDKYYDQISPTGRDVVSMIVREPIGVVGAIVPWNFPTFMMAWKLGPALAGGNSVVVKPSEQTSITALRLAELAVEAGLPEGVLNVVPGVGNVAGQALARHMDVDCISFTGSTAVGRSVLGHAATTNLKKVILECGGKSPAIVLDDAYDLSAVARHVALGILFCQGENCSANSRLLVQKGSKDALMRELVAEFERWTVGDPLSADTRIGAMIDERHLRRVMGYIDKGVEEGANVAFGGKRVLEETGGYFVQPTIFDGVNQNMVIAREEIFGPVLSVIEFDDEAEAVKMANDSDYGLASSVYTSDLNKAHKIARELRAGTVSVNCYSEGDMAVPFGGFKQSGFGGRDKSMLAHDQYQETKAIWINLAS